MSFWNDLMSEWQLRHLVLHFQGSSREAIDAEYKAHLRAWLARFEASQGERRRATKTAAGPEERAHRFSDFYHDGVRAEQVRREIAGELTAEEAAAERERAAREREAKQRAHQARVAEEQAQKLARREAHRERLYQAYLERERLEHERLYKEETAPPPPAEPSSLACDACPRRFGSALALEQHKRAKHRQDAPQRVVPPQKPLPAPRVIRAAVKPATRLAPGREPLRSVVVIRAPGLAALPYPCPRCQCAFRTQAAWTGHVREVHPDMRLPAPAPAKAAATRSAAPKDGKRVIVKVLRNRRSILVDLHGDPETCRINHCWSCKEPLTSDVHTICEDCRGMRCTEGHCFCGMQGVLWGRR